MATVTSAQEALIGRLWPARTMPLALRRAILMLAGTVFVGLSAQIEAPLWPVPVTMQTFAVLVIGMAYGGRLGAATLALYLAEGAIGLPVFAGGTGGIWVLVGPTGGYLVGFVAAAGIVGALAQRGWDRNVALTAAGMLIGNVVLYVPGLLWLAKFTGADQAVALGLAPFLVGDALKVALAACLMPLAWRVVGRRRG